MAQRWFARFCMECRLRQELRVPLGMGIEAGRTTGPIRMLTVLGVIAERLDGKGWRVTPAVVRAESE